MLAYLTLGPVYTMHPLQICKYNVVSSLQICNSLKHEAACHHIIPKLNLRRLISRFSINIKLLDRRMLKNGKTLFKKVTKGGSLKYETEN